MAVLLADRKQSEMEVFANMRKLRNEITKLVLNSFGYDVEKKKKQILKSMQCKSEEELSGDQRKIYDKRVKKAIRYAKWFTESERNALVNFMREASAEMYIANSIFPTSEEEYYERRIHQNKAIAACTNVLEELQYIVDTLPVDVNKYTPYALLIEEEIKLLRTWRKSNKKKFGYLIPQDKAFEVKHIKVGSKEEQEMPDDEKPY